MKSPYFFFYPSAFFCPNRYSTDLQNSLRTCSVLITELSNALHCINQSQKWKLCYDLRFSQPVCLGLMHPSRVTTSSLLLSDSCRLVDVGRSLWRDDGSVICQTPSAVIHLLSVRTIYMLQVIKCMYIQHMQSLCRSRLSTADHALSLIAPATTAVQ
jgi:hypothetical protein